MVVSTYWGHHYSGVVAATADKAEDIVDEEMFDVEAMERVGYGEIGSLDGILPSRRPRILLVWCLCPRVPGVKILHRRLRGIPLMVRIR